MLLVKLHDLLISSSASHALRARPFGRSLASVSNSVMETSASRKHALESDGDMNMDTSREKSKFSEREETFSWPKPTAESLAELPKDYATVSEASTTIAYAVGQQSVFYNPIQAFNRDLSVAVIQTWARDMQKEKVARLSKRKEIAARKKERAESRSSPTNDGRAESKEDQYHKSLSAEPVYRYSILEALSATGLRAIRYAKELENISFVVANDKDPAAVDIIRQNAELNGVLATGADDLAIDHLTNQLSREGKVRPQCDDAMSVLYSSREPRKRFNVVDLDPYGSAAPFMDGAVQATTDKGLLCVTCTDLAVLAGSNYPEKCWSHYGGVPAKAEYTHEVALRLLLHTISASAARYGRYITPLVSLSIDYYIRCFVRIDTGPDQVKRLASKTMIIYQCTQCDYTVNQAMGRQIESKNGAVKYSYPQGPPTESSHCPQCRGRMHMAGPMWADRLHEREFVESILDMLNKEGHKFTTSARMRGMLSVASEELDAPFYFSCPHHARVLHCESPPTTVVTSALLNAGYRVSATHAMAGGIKTDAPHELVWDIFRHWSFSKNQNIHLSKWPESSACHQILSQSPRSEVSFSSHPDAGITATTKRAKATHNLGDQPKVVRYQNNPTRFWGPQTKARPSKNNTGDKSNDTTSGSFGAAGG